MKTKMMLTLCVLLIAISTKAQKQVVSIEGEIESILLKPQMERVSKLNELLARIPTQLKDVNATTKNYWVSYTHYKIGLYHLASDKEQANKSFEKALKTLQAIEEPNSENLALEGTITSTQISVQSDKAWSLSQKASKKFQQSLELNAKNPRTHLGLGKSDFYKPSEYGGGEKVDAHLKKALQYYKEEELNKKAPSWGKDEVYYFLSAFYSREQSFRDAKFYNSLGLKEFPKNELLLAQKEQLN